MARELGCADLMPGCNFVAQGRDDSEVMKQAAEHAKSAHRLRSGMQTRFPLVFLAHDAPPLGLWF
jgi:predicted small metal-binding protein